MFKEFFMKLKEELLKELFDDSFCSDCLEGNNTLERYSVSAITAICNELLENDGSESSQELNTEGLMRIMEQCSHIMRMVDLRSVVKEMFDNRTDFFSDLIEMNEFLTSFANECKLNLKNVCAFDFEAQKPVYKKISRKYLEYALLLYIRCSVVKGVKKIDISLKCEDKDIIIVFSEAEYGKPVETDSFWEVVTVDYALDIAELVSKRLGITLNVKENGIELKMKHDDDSDDLVMKSPARRYRKSYYNPYMNMLVDLRNISII